MFVNSHCQKNSIEFLLELIDRIADHHPMKKTPLHAIHKHLGARMVEFGGWEMPVQYAGIREEHLAVRQKAGVFDVSHMGEIAIRGKKALAMVQKITCNDASRLRPGQSQYSALLNEQGTFIDDIIVNRLADDSFLFCVNASNADKDFEWIRSQAIPEVTVENKSDDYSLIALQGPEADKILAALEVSPRPEKAFTTVSSRVAGCDVLLSRTGYTGEDGFEIYGNPKEAEKIWSALLEKGAIPCGLGARDTLRVEAALPLYGHEISDTIDPFEARLNWIVKMEKGNFIGREALLTKMKPTRLLVGIGMIDPGIARQGYSIFHQEEAVGSITSGTQSPLLDRPIALGYAKKEFAAVETKLSVDIHKKRRHAEVVPLPFYKRKK